MGQGSPRASSVVEDDLHVGHLRLRAVGQVAVAVGVHHPHHRLGLHLGQARMVVGAVDDHLVVAAHRARLVQPAGSACFAGRRYAGARVRGEGGELVGDHPQQPPRLVGLPVLVVDGHGLQGGLPLVARAEGAVLRAGAAFGPRAPEVLRPPGPAGGDDHLVAGDGVDAQFRHLGSPLWLVKIASLRSR